MEQVYSKVEMTEQSISESEERPIEMIQSEYQKYIKKKNKKWAEPESTVEQ